MLLTCVLCLRCCARSSPCLTDALADAAAALLRLVGADDVDPISTTDWTELERQGVDEVLLSLLKEQTQTNLVLKQAVMLMARGVAAVEANAMSQRLPSRPVRLLLLDSLLCDVMTILNVLQAHLFCT